MLTSDSIDLLHTRLFYLELKAVVEDDFVDLNAISSAPPFEAQQFDEIIAEEEMRGEPSTSKRKREPSSGEDDQAEDGDRRKRSRRDDSILFNSFGTGMEGLVQAVNRLNSRPKKITVKLNEGCEFVIEYPE